MKQQNVRAFLSACLLACLLWQAVPARAMQVGGASAGLQVAGAQNGGEVFDGLMRQARGEEYAALLEKIFGADAGRAASALDEDSGWLIQSVAEGAGRRAAESLEEQIKGRDERPADKSKRVAAAELPRLDWRQLAFGFQHLPQETKPQIQMTETDKEIKASGEDKKSFETKEAKGTRTQKAETRYTKDGKTFGVEIKNTDGGSFSFSFPFDPTQRIVSGSVTVREDDGGTTVYTWELTRR